MFSKPLFKQSLKANWVSWLIITFLNCFMLACVMTIAGGGTVGNIADAVTDVIVQKSIESEAKKLNLTFYVNGLEGQEKFDTHFVEGSRTYLGTQTTSATAYAESCSNWAASLEKDAATGLPKAKENEASIPAPDDTNAQKAVYNLFYSWADAEPQTANYIKDGSFDSASFAKDAQTWAADAPTTEKVTSAITQGLSADVVSYAPTIYAQAVAQTQEDAKQKALEENKDLTEATVGQSETYQEIQAAYLAPINPANSFDEYFSKHEEDIPEDYDVTSLLLHVSAGDSDAYLTSDERSSYHQDRAAYAEPILVADIFTSDSFTTQILDALESYHISADRYAKYGYTYDKVHTIGGSAVASYRGQYDYRLGLLQKDKEKGKFASDEEYAAAVTAMSNELRADVAASFFDELPAKVTDALDEVAHLDMYSLVVGSVYYKMAGMLLPIIYTIMVSNSLIAGSVDRGSMAYVLSTGAKRSTVVFTQAVFLAASQFAMVLCMMLTSYVCLACVDLEFSSMTYGTLTLMALGAFLTLFAIGGLNHFCSCVFNRSSRAMGIGGGLSIFFLVATMLGLFGSKVIPSIIRFDALNYFNYVSLISLYDVPSIIDGTTTWIWKAAILFAVGLCFYIAGSQVFKKKDLPL